MALCGFILPWQARILGEWRHAFAPLRLLDGAWASPTTLVSMLVEVGLQLENCDVDERLHFEQNLTRIVAAIEKRAREEACQR